MERWKDIDGFPGYQVSDKGNVRTSISHVLCGDFEKTRHYTFEYASWEDRLLYGLDDH